MSGCFFPPFFTFFSFFVRVIGGGGYQCADGEDGKMMVKQ